MQKKLFYLLSITLLCSLPFVQAKVEAANPIPETATITTHEIYFYSPEKVMQNLNQVSDEQESMNKEIKDMEKAFTKKAEKFQKDQYDLRKRLDDGEKIEPEVLQKEIERIQAEGAMLEQEKNDLMNLDKTYEIEVVLGIQTDTSDALGIIESVSDVCEHKDVKSFIGPYVRPYPKYSSRNIKKTLKNDEPDGGTIAIQKGYIYDVLEKEERLVDSSGMEKNIFEKLSLSRMPSSA